MQIAGSKVGLDAHPTSIQTEIHQARPDALAQLGHAAIRLSVPFEPQSTPLPSARLAAIPLERSQSSPAAQPRPTNGVPLKTRVVQMLALGNLTSQEVATGAKAPEADVMRVVTVVRITVRVKMTCGNGLED